MPFVQRGDANIYWETRGEGAPLMLVNGLGAAIEQWFRIAPALASRFRLILFDNRGIGRTDVPPTPFTIQAMADDAAAVMEAAGEQSAHVIGNSMGGMIAQELVLRHPDRVRSLILGCTTCGRGGVPATREVLASIRPNPDLSREELFWSTVPVLYAASTPQERLEEDLVQRLAIRRPIEGYSAQLVAINTWPGTRDRLGGITVPTLVLHGENDRLIPAENGRILARGIPGARLVVLEHAAHMMYADEFEAARDAVLSFLDSKSGIRLQPD